MNDAYDDPFLPLPSLPPTSPRPEALPDIMMADAVHSESAAYRGKRENEKSDFTVDFDAYSLENEVMQSESDDDCSEESDIDLLDSIQASPFLYEPINLFSAHNEHDASNKKWVPDEYQVKAQEDSLSALPVMSSTSSIKGYVNIGQSHLSASEHGTSLSATSYNSGATGEEAAGSQPGYNFYSRPQSYTLKRPSYAVEKNNFWETKSAQSLHSSHSVTSTQSAPVLSGQRTNASFGRFPNTKFEESEAITARTTTCSSSCNEIGIDSSETYSFYSRPSTNYTLKRPAYALNRTSSDNNLSQYRVDSSINMDTVNGRMPENSLNNVETNSNDFQMPNLSLSEHYNNLKSMRSSRKNNFFIHDQSFDNVSVKSMPAPDIPKLGQQVFSHPCADLSNDEFNLDTVNGRMPETSLNNVETNPNDIPMPNLSLSEHYNNLKSIRRSSRKFGIETEPGNHIREKSFDNVSVKSMPAPDIPKLGQQVFSHPCADLSSDESLENSPIKTKDLESEEKSMEDVPIEVKPKVANLSEQGTKLVTESDRVLATAFSHAVLSEYGRARFRESDRQGKRKGLGIGFPGISCIHCNGTTKKSGRFFPSSIKTMADTKKTLMSIHNHLVKCSSCPQSVKEKIVLLKEGHEDERKTQKYGSQKAFFSNIWERLHG